jgi:hypothetical protein
MSWCTSKSSATLSRLQAFGRPYCSAVLKDISSLGK